MAFAIKAEVCDPRAKTFAFTALNFKFFRQATRRSSDNRLNFFAPASRSAGSLTDWPRLEGHRDGDASGSFAGRSFLRVHFSPVGQWFGLTRDALGGNCVPPRDLRRSVFILY